MITQRDEGDIKRNLRHFPVISSEWQIIRALQIEFIWHLEKLSHIKKTKQDTLNLKTK